MRRLSEIFKGKSWEKVEAELSENPHILAVSEAKGDEVLEVARAFHRHGPECGMACLAAAMFLEQWGAGKTVLFGVGIYDELRKSGLWRSFHEFEEMAYWTAWMGAEKPAMGARWPLRPAVWPPEDPDKRAGLANVMLLLGGQKLGGANTEVIAQRFVFKFLERGMARKGLSFSD